MFPIDASSALRLPATEPRPAPSTSHAPAAEASVAGPRDGLQASPPAPPPLDPRQELEGIIHKPWGGLSPALQALAAMHTPEDGAALQVLRGAERKGLWGDGDSAALQDLVLLRFHLPEGASLGDAARGYARLLEAETKAHSDGTPHARLAAIGVASTLRPGESMAEAAEVHAVLLPFESGRDIDGSRHAREAYLRVDRNMVDSQTRMTAAQEYMRDPDSFEKRQAAERERFQQRQAEVARIASEVSREPRSDLKIEHENEWIVVAGVRVPRRQ